ncbi:MAG: histidine kinase dimerization/phospho-acceptor domain-containing protein, partial [Oscillospiraceae bacterium]
MKKRIFMGMCLIAFIAVLVTSTFSVLAVFQDNSKALKEQIIVEADYVKTAYDRLGVEYLNHLNTSIGGRLTVIDRDGTVIYDSQANAASLENHGDRKEVRDALEKGSGSSSRVSSTLHQETYYYAVKLADGNVIRVANTVSTIYSALTSVFPWLVGIVILSLFIAVCLANVETKRIVNPINSINLDAPKENEIYDEFSPLLVRMERQRAQIKAQMDELSLKQQEFTSITDNMSEGLIVVDKKGEVLSDNKSALKLCGYREASACGQSVFAMNHNIEFCRAVEGALHGKSTEHHQKISGRFCRFFISPVESGISGAVIVIMDVTEKENREELRREFTANVSHELKTPLTSISGYAEIMRNGIAKDKDIPAFADKIYFEAQRLIELVADIIKLSRLDEADGSLQKVRCDLYQIAESAVKRLEP